MEREVLFTLDVRPDGLGRFPWAQVVPLRENTTGLAPVGGPDGAVVLSYTAAPDAQWCDHVLYLVAAGAQVPDVMAADYLGAVATSTAGVLHAWLIPADEDSLADARRTP